MCFPSLMKYVVFTDVVDSPIRYTLTAVLRRSVPRRTVLLASFPCLTPAFVTCSFPHTLVLQAEKDWGEKAWE